MQDKLVILEKSDGIGNITLTYIRVTEQELRDTYVTHVFLRYSVKSIPVFKDTN